MSAVELSVSPEQAQLLADAVRQRDAAIAHAAMVLAVLTAGQVPRGAVLQDIDTDRAVLTFSVPVSAD